MKKIICPECGVELEPDAKECTNCGYPLDDEYAAFKRKERKAIKWAKYAIYLSICIIILMALIFHFVGNTNKKERTEKTINYLVQNEVELKKSDDIDTYISFNSDGDCYIREESDDDYYDDDDYDYDDDDIETNGEVTYKVKYSFFGREFLKLKVEWDDDRKTEIWKLPIGRNKNNKIVLLGKNNTQESGFYNLEFDEDESIVYKNSNKILYFWMIIFLALLGCGGFVWNVFSIKNGYKTLVKNKELKEKQDRINKEKETLSAEWDKVMENLGYSSKEYVYLGNRNYLWVAKEKLCEAENRDSYISRYLGKNDLEHRLSYYAIPVSDIQYYSKEGDIQYTTKISGGGGGGSSISGAVVGGLIAGETGAVIGSRQKVQEVTSETVKHDSRRTLIRYYKDKQINVISYIGFEVYDYLLKKIPEKDLLTIQLEKKPVVREEQKSDSIKDKLETIKQLYENDLITKEEYEQKRNEILSKI